MQMLKSRRGFPAQDLGRARKFYSEKLGLEPIEERPGGLRYRCGSSFFVLFQSAGAASGTHTQMGIEVEDLDATIAALRARGVAFEDYDLPGLTTRNGVADIAGNARHWPARAAIKGDIASPRTRPVPAGRAPDTASVPAAR